MSKVRWIHNPFTFHVPVRLGSKPEVGYNGQNLRTTVTMGTALINDRPVHINMQGGNHVDSTISITIEDNDFSTGNVVLILNDEYTITFGLDFIIGADVDETAANLSSCVNNIPGFLSTSLDEVCTIYTSGLKATYILKQMGSITNVSIDPDNGYFQDFSPDIEGPEID
jgi:hypothetical protein